MTVKRPFHATRRSMLLSAPLLGALRHAPRAHAAPSTAPPRPVVDQQLRRLRLPPGTVGRDYILLQMKVGDQGPFDFMVDTGLSAELITPHLRQTLGIPPAKLKLDKGMTAGGTIQGADLVQLKDATIVGAPDWLGPLPPLLAVVSDFVQEHLDPEHDVEGMLGMELLRLFDTDFDFPAGRLRLWRPGEGVAAAEAAGLVEVPAAVLNESGVLGIRVTSPQAPIPQPFVGILDSGASFSALNWQAAALAGLPPRDDPAYGSPGRPTLGVAVLGVDGKAEMLPTTTVQFTFAGQVHKSEEGKLSFDAPPPGWQPWAPGLVAVGDLPVFAQLLGDGTHPFTGPAALLGLDILAQRRCVIGAGFGRQGRARQLLVGGKS